MRTKIFVYGLVIMMMTLTVMILNKPQPTYAGDRILVPAYPLNQTDVDFLAATMWGEARGQGSEGMLAVGLVVLNRRGMRHSWVDVESVVTSPHQFSVWTKSDPNYKKLFTSHNKKEYKEAVRLAQDLLRGHHTDITNGAVYYHSNKVDPFWASHMERTVTIGDHIFYKEK